MRQDQSPGTFCARLLKLLCSARAGGCLSFGLSDSGVKTKWLVALKRRFLEVPKRVKDQAKSINTQISENWELEQSNGARDCVGE